MRIRKFTFVTILLLVAGVSMGTGLWVGTQRGPIPQTIGDWLYNFQTLIAGALAVLAAAVGSWGLLRSARMPIEEQKRRERDERKQTRAYLRESLMGEFRVMIDRARGVESQLNTYQNTLHTISEENRERMTLRMPEVTFDAQSMILLGPEVMARCAELARTIEQHNAHLKHATGQIGSTGVWRHMRDRAHSIADMAHQLANQILFNLRA